MQIQAKQVVATAIVATAVGIIGAVATRSKRLQRAADDTADTGLDNEFVADYEGFPSNEEPLGIGA